MKENLMLTGTDYVTQARLMDPEIFHICFDWSGLENATVKIMFQESLESLFNYSCCCEKTEPKIKVLN